VGIARRSAYTFAAQVVSFVLGMVTSIVIARTLGAEGRGVLALFMILLQTVLALATLGLSFALAYLTGKDRFPTSSINGAAVVLSFAIWVVVVAVALPLGPLLRSSILRGLEDWHYMLVLAALPFALISMMLQGVMLGTGRVERLALVAVTRSVLTTSAYVIALSLLGLHLGAAVIIAAAGNLLHAGLYWRETVLRDGISLAGFRQIAREAISYGSKVYFGNLSSHFWLRADVYILNLFHGPVATGYYTLATNLAEKVWVLEGSVMQAVLPNLIRGKEDEAKGVAARTSRSLALLAGAGSLILGALTPWLIPLFYTDEFRPAIVPLLVLLPGIVALTVARVYSGYYSFQLGRPLVVSAVALVTASVSAVLYLLLVPRYGLIGAAAGTTISYVIPLAIYLVKVPRDTGLSVREMLFVTREDLRILVRTLARLLRLR